MMDIILSVIIPLYNAMPYFEQTVESILVQGEILDEVEVIIVDDGSTDGGGEFADSLAQGRVETSGHPGASEHSGLSGHPGLLGHPGLFKVVHIEHSGGPSRPRNVGVDHAVGKYLFFCDADDRFEPEAFGRMLAHAREWKPDLMLVKLVGEGRNLAKTMYRINQPKADVLTSKVFNSLSPMKLCSTAFWKRNGFRYDERLTIHEDEVLFTEAYFKAKVVSVASDYDYYRSVWREEGNNLNSVRCGGFDNDFLALEREYALIDAYQASRGCSREQLEKVVLPRVTRSTVTGCLHDAAEDPVQKMDEELDKLRALCEPYLTATLVESLQPSIRLLVGALLDRDYGFVRDFARRAGLSVNGIYESYPLHRDMLACGGGHAVLAVDAGGHTRATDVTRNLPVPYEVVSVTPLPADGGCTAEWRGTDGDVRSHDARSCDVRGGCAALRVSVDLLSDEFWGPDTRLSMELRNADASETRSFPFHRGFATGSGDVREAVDARDTADARSGASVARRMSTIVTIDTDMFGDKANRHWYPFLHIECDDYGKDIAFGSALSFAQHEALDGVTLLRGILPGHTVKIAFTAAGNLRLSRGAGR